MKYDEVWAADQKDVASCRHGVRDGCRFVPHRMWV